MEAPAAVGALALLLASGCFSDAGGDRAPAPTQGTPFRVSAGLAFGPAVKVHEAPSGAEPGAAAALDGTLYVVAWTSVYRSRDDGAKWQRLATPFSHNGDSDLAVGGDGTLHFVAMPLKSQPGPRLPYYQSRDAGDTWRLAADLGAPDRSVDRPWIASDGGRRLAVTWNDIDADENLARVSNDAGATWTDAVVLAKPRYKVPGPPLFRGDAILQALNRFQAIDVASTGDGGRTWQTRPGPASGGTPTGFPVLAVDAAGRLLLAVTVAEPPTSERRARLWTAADPGVPWEGPALFSAAGESVMPWVVAGEAGHAAVAYYQSRRTVDDRDPVQQLLEPRNVTADWSVHVALLGAPEGSGAARVSVLQASDGAVHRGEICTNGAACPPAQWVFKDYFEMVPTPRGDLLLVHVADPERNGGPFRVMASVSKPGP